MHFYLDEKTPYVPAGTMPQTVDIDRDGTVTLVDHDTTYDLAFKAMGGDESSYLVLQNNLEDHLHRFFVERDLVSREIMSLLCKRAMDRLLRGVEEFDPKVVQPYRMRLEGKHEGPIFASDLIRAMEKRTLEVFKNRPDLSFGQYSLFVRAVKTVAHKAQDVFMVGFEPIGPIGTCYVLFSCREGAFHVNSLRQVCRPAEAASPGVKSMEAEHLLQLGDFLDATQAERSK